MASSTICSGERLLSLLPLVVCTCRSITVAMNQLIVWRDAESVNPVKSRTEIQSKYFWAYARIAMIY